MKFGISVKEVLQRTVIVEAESLDEAIEKVEDAVTRSEIILDADDFLDRDIEPSKYFENGMVPEDKDVSYYWHLD